MMSILSGRETAVLVGQSSSFESSWLSLNSFTQAVRMTSLREVGFKVWAAVLRTSLP